MARLGVNVDHVATIRQARRGAEPDPIAAAVLAELAGTDSIIVHLREDRRHIQDRDLRLLREIVQTRLNLEMASTQEMVKIALDIKPDMVTLVPERREELTTEGGLEVALNKESLKPIVTLLRDAGIIVSAFIEPDLNQIKACHAIEVDCIEIHTGVYAEVWSTEKEETEFEKISNAARFAKKLGLRVNAGHGLTYHNVVRIAHIKEIEELNIGHSIVSRALLVGFERAVREMKALIR